MKVRDKAISFDDIVYISCMQHAAVCVSREAVSVFSYGVGLDFAVRLGGYYVFFI